jgi:hypothetical protein
MRVGFRGLKAEVDASAGERVCSWNCTGRASARPEELSPAACRYLVSTTLVTLDASRSMPDA